MKTFKQFTAEAYGSLDEIYMITPVKKSQPKTKAKSDKDRYGEDPEETRKRVARKIKELKDECEYGIDEGIGMTMANALGNPPALSKRMKLKRVLIAREIEKNTKKNKNKKYSGKAESGENVQELFITRKSPEQRADEKRKKKVAELIRLMQHAKNPHSDVASRTTKTEEYEIEESTINKQIRNTKERDTAMVSRDRGSQSEKQNRKERKSTEKTLRRSGHGFSKNVGSYDEGGGKGIDTEVSYQVTRNPKKNSRKGFERKMRNLGKKKGPSGEAQHSVITQRAGKEAKLVSTDGSGEKPFSIGKAKFGNNPDPAIGQTTAGKIRSKKKPSSNQTEKNVKQNRSFHYSSEE
jgi:hypothetical protein